MVVVLLYRDLLTSVVRVFAIKRGVVVAARVSGKLKAITQAAAIITVLVAALVQQLSEQFARAARLLEAVGMRGGSPQSVAASAFWIMWVVVLVAVWSGLDYFWACRRHIAAAAGSPGDGGPGPGESAAGRPPDGP
jgi:CDP-diacylglycerol--glycerol-3-phosphate 3-phosphatidyltransferase